VAGCLFLFVALLRLLPWSAGMMGHTL
jgi:hypothetical protein